MRIEVTKDKAVAVMGLGYFSSLLYDEFGKQFKAIGFDLSESK